MIFSLYVFDRHCICIYYHDWHRARRPRPGVAGAVLPAVSRAVLQSSAPTLSDPSASGYSSPRNTLSSNSGIVLAVANDGGPMLALSPTHPQAPDRVPSPLSPVPGQPLPPMAALPFDEEAKLVYGVLISLRNMVKKLSGRDEQFTGYKTSTYRFHLFETLSGYKFVLLSDPSTDGLRETLRQLYGGPFVQYVVKNPLVNMDDRAAGIDNDNFRKATDMLIRSHPAYAT
ncbi:snare-like protein [Auriculariales sp. MPI-PUGE-AT-0066]|nr:snare-like protein [Auriculariales sp. MPI-PUGE-AT-0066]